MPRPQIEPGSLLQNVGFDSLTIYNSTIKSAATLVRKWPVDIADAEAVPAAFESSSNTMLIEFQTGGYSGSADSYQGFSARCRAPLLTPTLPSAPTPCAPRANHALAEPNCGDALAACFSSVAHGPAFVLARRYVATATGTMSTLQLTPTAASDNSSELLTITVSISPMLQGRIDAAEAGGRHAYECKFVSNSLAGVEACDAPLGEGVATVAATKQGANAFTCPLPTWGQAGTNETVGVVLTRNPAVGTDETMPCTRGDPLQLLFYANPMATKLTPSEGGVGTTIIVNCTGMLDPTDASLSEFGLVSQCRFERSTLVDAEWVSNTEIKCVAPVPTAAGPNPVAFVEVTNNGYDWTPPLDFTYKTYCGQSVTFTQSVGSIKDHSGAFSSLPNSLCDFRIEPLEENAEGAMVLAPGGVQLSFDTLDIGPQDAVKVYRTTATGELELLIDAGAYFNEFRTTPPPSMLKSRKAGTDFHGLPAVITYRTGPITFTSGISVSYVSLSGYRGANGEMIYCPLPSLNCPAVITNTGFSVNEASISASRLQVGALASSSVQVGGMAMHYIEVAAPADNEDNDDYRIIEVEVHLVNPSSSVTVLVMEQPYLVYSTDFATDPETGDCLDTTLGAQLDVCPNGDLDLDREQANTVAEGYVSGGKVRLAYCVMPRENRTTDHLRLAVAVYGDSAAGEEAADSVIAYKIEFRDLPMPKLEANLDFMAYDGSLVSEDNGGAIGWMVADDKKIMQVMASRVGANLGSLLIQRGACPTRSDHLYSMQPNSVGSYGVSVADCNSTSAGCKTSTANGVDVLWFVGLLSTAGQQVVAGLNQSLTSRVKIDAANDGHGFSALCSGADTPDVYTDSTCGGVQCTHLLTPSQTHHFVARDVDPLRVLKVDACVTVDQSDGALCLPENELGADHQLAISISPMQAGSAGCLDADAAGPGWPDATFADASPRGGSVDGVTQWPFQGHYRLSRCTGGFDGNWLVSVTARIGSSSAFVPYKLSIYYQGAPSTIDLSNTPEIEVTTYAGDWSYFVVQGVSSDNELTVRLSMPIGQIKQGGAVDQAAVELYLSDIQCPDPELQDPANYTAVTYPVLSTAGEPEQRLMVTRTLDPPENCSASAEATTKTLYVGVKGASSTLLKPGGSKFRLTLSSSSLKMMAGEARTVAVQGGGYVVLEVEVQTVYGLNVQAQVSEAAGTITTDSLNLIMMPKVDRDEVTCGAPILMNKLTDPAAVAGATQPGQSALPLVLSRGTVDNDGVMTLALSVVESPACANKVAVEGEYETWYIALRVPDDGPTLVYANLLVTESPKEFLATDTKVGNLLKAQWAHFEVKTVGEGTISLNVDTTCFGTCLETEAWKASLMLVAKSDTATGCPNDEPTDTGNLQSATGDKAVFIPATNSLRFSINLCTSAGSTYRIGIRGMGGVDAAGVPFGDYPAPYEGGGTDYRISSSSVPQANMATFTVGQVLSISMSNGEWQYHYLEMPDPTCAGRAEGCLKGVNTKGQAENCIIVNDENVEVVRDECKNNANFPADVTLTTRGVGGAVKDGVQMYAAVGDCGSINNEDNRVPRVDGTFVQEYKSTRLLNEYLLSQVKAIRDLDLDPLKVACNRGQVISCVQCAKRSNTGTCDDPCCFSPKIYVGLNGQPAIITGTRADYELVPSLLCQGGYKQAGGTYAEACEECEPGKYSPGGQTECTNTPPGYYSPGGEPAPIPCDPGSFSDVEAAEVCTACDLGKFQAIAGKKECDDCPEGTYNVRTGQTECIPCPDTFTSQKGSLALRQCFCQVNFYKTNMQNAEFENDKCLKCPLNSVCRGGCESPPSAGKCSDEPWMPDVDRQTKLQLYGSLLFIPKAMPYPTVGYYQQLALEFTSGPMGIFAYDGVCEREGQDACWWPFIDPLTKEMLPMVSSGHVLIPNKKVYHNGQEFDQPWWLNDFKLSYPIAATFFETQPAALDEGLLGFGKSLQCEEKYWTYADGVAGVGCDTCLTGAGLYFLQAGKCTACQQGFSIELIILGIICFILLGALLVVLSKIGFNWAAISISINFLQVSAIFANFSIEWPEEVLALLAMFKLFTIDVDAVNTECAVGRVSYFEKWIIMVLAPFIVVGMLSSVSSTVKSANWIMGKTRFPVWTKRKLWRLLKPPIIGNDAAEDDELAVKISKKLRNGRRKAFFKVLSILTKPIPRAQLETLEDAIFNAFVTFLSVYYMTGVKRSLEIFRCITKNPELMDATNCPDFNAGDDTLRLIYTKKILFASDGAGEVVCSLYNYTTCNFEPRPGPGPPTQGLFKFFPLPLIGKTTINSPSYTILQYMATFFTMLYGVCIPLFIFLALTQGKHQLNHLSFGRRYGYLYKRYEVQYFWWECTVMVRKSALSVVDIFVGLENGAYLPGQQAVAGMCVVVTFLLLQAAFTPYSEGHLDALESILLFVNYNFLFMGLCSYAIYVSSPTADDKDMQWILTICMTFILIMGLIFLILFLSLDLTLQMVRLYFRYIEGEGKFGKRQELVLQDLDKETRRLQELGGRLLAPNQRQLFQKWLNNAASDDEKLLTKAAFTSLMHYLRMHSDHSMPWLIQYSANLPLLGGYITWAYKKQHEFWLNEKKKRNQKLSNISKSSESGGQSSSRLSGAASPTPESSSLRATSAGSFIQRKGDSIAKKVGGLGAKVGGLGAKVGGLGARLQ